jgi:hypothetical protein
LEVIATSLSGDYNGNGTVDAADYTVWRNTFGDVGSGLAADGNGNGQIDDGDYNVWKSHFGETAGSGAGGASHVPEPSASAIACLALLAAFFWDSRHATR